MKTRCFNENCSSYSNYGARGITVSKRWQNFSNFLEDMGKCPKGMSLERKNVNGNYTKSNCVWASHYDQSRNKRTNNYMSAYGKMMIISDWAKAYNMSDTTFRRRIKKHGWPLPSPPPKAESE